MIYTYNNNILKFEKMANFKIFLIVISIMIFTIGILTYVIPTKETFITEEARTILIKEQNEFSETKLKEYLIELNIKFPDIVLAQSKLESFNYKSKIFIENNNLFGMKISSRRPTTALGEESGHAFYSNWRQSVLDYAFYQATYLRSVKTESEYFQYLSANYAEDSNYVAKLKKIVK